MNNISNHFLVGEAEKFFHKLTSKSQCSEPINLLSISTRIILITPLIKRRGFSRKISQPVRSLAE